MFFQQLFVVVLQSSVLPQWLIQFGLWIEHVTKPLRQTLQPFLSSPIVLGVWLVLIAVSLGVLWWDLRKRNQAIGPLMKLVWTLTVLFSGPIALAVYWWSGRTQIPHDSIWRGGWRSASHCYSGCGPGEVVGLIIAAVIGVGIFGTVLLTFFFAYLFGYALNIGPLMEDGVPFGEAAKESLYSETLSIGVFEIVAVGADLILAPTAGVTSVLFWMALFVSLSIGYLLVYPLNAGLISRGVKGGMSNPAEAGS
jgi:hypothetical protein